MEDKADSGASNKITDDDAHFEGKNISQRLINNFSYAQAFNSNDLRDEQEDNQDQNTEAILADSLTLEKEIYNNDRNMAIVGTRRIVQNSDLLLTMILREESKEITKVEQLLKIEKMQEKVDTMSKNSVPSLSSQSAAGLPECESSIFSAASPPFGSVLPYSDSISLRSNSTTSMQSFAFPILATEWEESPVRMAEADRRRLERPRCLKMCFACFTF